MLPFLVVALPVASGVLAGLLTRWRLRHSFAGTWPVVALVVAALVAADLFAATIRTLWFWDAAFEALVFVFSFLSVTHRGLARPRAIAMILCSAALGCATLELAARLFLPKPPFFLEFSWFERNLIDPTRTPDAQVCRLVYPGKSVAHLESTPRVVIAPDTYVPRPGSGRHVLHLGDSSVYGWRRTFGETLQADLDRTEPGTENINGAVPGTAPDDYFAILTRWLEHAPPQAVAMYISEASDLRDIDSLKPCANWQSLLTYDGGRARLRYLDGPHAPIAPEVLEFYPFNSPPPYLVRRALQTSSAAAFVVMGMQLLRYPDKTPRESEEVHTDHLQAVLATARQLLSAKRIPFAVVVLPLCPNEAAGEPARRIGPIVMKAAERAGVQAIDAASLLCSLPAGQRSRLYDDGVHFTAEGNTLLAGWLHEQLPGAFARDAAE